jgi:hypothetical protein
LSNRNKIAGVTIDEFVKSLLFRHSRVGGR